MEDLQQYIYEHIPVIRQNNFTVADENDCIEVCGKFSDHINHRNSVFGGSLSTAMILSAWAYVRKIIIDCDCSDTIIVIQSQDVKFIDPVTKDFCAISVPKTGEEKKKLIDTLNRFGKSRINVRSIVTHLGGGAKLAEFKGDFVIVKKK
jgi:thioesterase domain-containing protein